MRATGSLLAMPVETPRRRRVTPSEREAKARYESLKALVTSLGGDSAPEGLLDQERRAVMQLWNARGRRRGRARKR